MNDKLAIEKKLIIGEDHSKYVSLKNQYKYYFEKYLLSKVNIIEYDNSIYNSNLDFGITENKIIYNGLKEYLPTKYLCILNDFFVEKLSIEQIAKLEEHMKKDPQAFDSEIYNIIDATYKDVIKNNFNNNEYVNDRYQINYGYYEVPSNFAYNDDLVIKLYYGRNAKYVDGEEFIQNLKAKKNFIQELEEKMTSEVKEKLGISMTLLFEKMSK